MRNTFSNIDSRRDLLRRAGSIAIFTGLAAIPRNAQAAKIPQATAGYQDSPHDGQVCQDCKHFSAPSSCQVVDGTISQQGWCKMYAAKS